MNKLRRRRPPIEGLGARLIIQRDTLRAPLGSQWLVAVSAAVGRWVFEYIGLLVALNAIAVRAVYDMPALSAVAIALLPYAALSAVLLLLVVVVSALHSLGVV